MLPHVSLSFALATAAALLTPVGSVAPENASPAKASCVAGLPWELSGHYLYFADYERARAQGYLVQPIVGAASGTDSDDADTGVRDEWIDESIDGLAIPYVVASHVTTSHASPGIEMGRIACFLSSPVARADEIRLVGDATVDLDVTGDVQQAGDLLLLRSAPTTAETPFGAGLRAALEAQLDAGSFHAVLRTVDDAGVEVRSVGVRWSDGAGELLVVWVRDRPGAELEREARRAIIESRLGDSLDLSAAETLVSDGAVVITVPLRDDHLRALHAGFATFDPLIYGNLD